jgi:hypothetical protein
MGFLDVLTGKRKIKGPAPDRLFAMSTAGVTLEMDMGLKSAAKAAIVFQPLGTADFDRLVADMEELVKSTGDETGTTITKQDDKFGYRWMVLNDPDYEDLVVGVNAVSSELQGGGYGDRLLAAVFPFEEKGKSLYLIYNFKRGAFYPFVPSGEKSRDSERELRLQSQLANEVPWEQDMNRWFPLWEIPL